MQTEEETGLELFEKQILADIDESYLSIIKQKVIELSDNSPIKLLYNELKQKKKIFPPVDKVFQALRLTKFNDVKVIIVGQDPYHDENQANGLAFSVNNGTCKFPPSLKRILREACVTDLNNGDLTNWAKQGVLLLNSILTVQAHKAFSHHFMNWESITNGIIYSLSKDTNDRSLVFLLWGAKAQEKKKFIDTRKHYIVLNSHPSPLCTKGDFIGCRCFQKANDFLIAQGLKPIDWNNSSISANNNLFNKQSSEQAALYEKKDNLDQVNTNGSEVNENTVILKLNTPDYLTAVLNPLAFPVKKLVKRRFNACVAFK